MDTYFTDQEYRLVLAALKRERKVCEETMRESNKNDVDLLELMNNIDKKINHIQYHYNDKIENQYNEYIEGIKEHKICFGEYMDEDDNICEDGFAGLCSYCVECRRECKYV